MPLTHSDKTSEATLCNLNLVFEPPHLQWVSQLIITYWIDIGFDLSKHSTANTTKKIHFHIKNILKVMQIETILSESSKSCLMSLWGTGYVRLGGARYWFCTGLLSIMPPTPLSPEHHPLWSAVKSVKSPKNFQSVTEKISHFME